MRVAYHGNFEAPHSTENHVARALENNGHDVARIQENGTRQWEISAKQVEVGSGADMILWTRTGWDYTKHGYSSNEEAQLWQLRFLVAAGKRRIPTVAYHLDLFFGLNPARVAVLDEPFFSCDLVCTADGGHQDQFAAKGINHVWFPPGVSEAECEPGMFRDEYHSPLAFVGNWSGDYHPESKHRAELVQWLQQNYARDCAFWPQRGHSAVRGADLRDLYASVDVVIGDSCFAGQVEDYWSDRIPETIGRGGFLIHPFVRGLDRQFAIGEPDEPVTWDQADLLTWEAGDWEDLGEAIEWALKRPDERRAMAAHGRQTVLQKHTYERRMKQLVETMQGLDLLPAPPKPKPKKKVAK